MRFAVRRDGAVSHSALLGDSPQRAYADKLLGFTRFVEPEIRSLIADLALGPGDRVLDAGCGAGLTTAWLNAAVVPGGFATGLDLALAHCTAAKRHHPDGIVQADLLRPPLRDASYDVVFTMNTINHLTAPLDGIGALARVVRSGGRLVVVQSHLVPEMLFSWDAVLERAVTDACHHYYRDKYDLKPRDTTASRRLLGMMRDAGVENASARTYVVERQQPLTEIDREYFTQVVWRGYLGAKIRPYLPAEQWEQLQRLCDPKAGEFALDRADFHHIETITVVAGTVSAT